MLEMQIKLMFVLLFSSGAVSANSGNLLRLTEFIADIYQQFPHGCKFIIHSEAQHQGFEATILMKSFRKYLAYEYFPIVEKKFRSDTRENCVAQRPIYIILRGNEETRRYINHVRNALSHLLLYHYAC